ncbi:MAG: recombination protein RecR [Candidatus Sericytochromatia bacterium]|nr:MAG: recombination protein RecR [Candidatus Sericytochromatia bacterium]
MDTLLYPQALLKLIEEFQKLPGIGPKSAQRIAFHIIKQNENNVKNLYKSIIDAKEVIKLCSICCNISTQEKCNICSNINRDKENICVVSEASDIIAIEKTKEFFGTYHVLHGLISPIEGIGPDKLKIKELISRINSETKEIILAISPSVEGETTTLYLKKLIKPLNVKVTRIAFGIPVGSELEYSDTITLAKAIEGRREI